MNEDLSVNTRPGQGTITSPVAAKESLGRTSFQRISSSGHQGHTANPTEHIASKRLAQGTKKSPNTSEINLLFEENPSEVRALKSAGMNDTQIFEILQQKTN